MKNSRFHNYYSDGSMVLSKDRYGAGNVMPEHEHDYLSVSLLLSGGLTEESDSETVLPKGGWLSIKPPFIPHSNLFTEDCTLLSIKIFDWNYYRLQLEDWDWFAPRGAIQQFIQLASNPNKKEAISIFQQFLKQPKQDPLAPPPWLLTLKSHIHEHYHETLQIASLAKEVHKHPVHVARSFLQYFGTDIKSYQRTLRMHKAMQLMLENKGNQAQIAYENGFADQSHFSREFKKFTSFSPRETLKAFDV